MNGLSEIARVRMPLWASEVGASGFGCMDVALGILFGRSSLGFASAVPALRIIHKLI